MSRGDKVIILQPVGAVDREAIAVLEEELGSIFGPIELRPAAKIPLDARVPKREQLEGAAVLQSLSVPDPGSGVVLLGVIDEDLFAADLNFVFGLAYGNRAIISLKRLRQEFYGLSPNSDLFSMRALKEAVHELGHLFGLPHCPDRRCVMHFSNSIADTDFKGWMYCDRCREILEESGVNVSIWNRAFRGPGGI